MAIDQFCMCWKTDGKGKVCLAKEAENLCEELDNLISENKDEPDIIQAIADGMEAMAFCEAVNMIANLEDDSVPVYGGKDLVGLLIEGAEAMREATQA